MRPFKIGVELPITEEKGFRGTPRWTDILAMATRSEEIGLDSIWVEDHLIFHSEERGYQGAWECWSLLAALAAATSKVEIAPLVSCVSFRNPALTAKMADTVDEISGGRLILGLGAGWNELEYTQFGFPYDHRVGRFEEALQIIHGLLHDGEIDFEGRFHSARECELRPRGPRPGGDQPHIPILLGTTGERMLRLTARYADQWNGYFPSFGNQASGIAPLREKVDAACASVGRDPATLERTATALVSMTGEPVYGAGAHWNTNLLSGTPEEIATALRAYAAEGITHLQVWLEPNTLAGLEAFAAVVEQLDKG
jgi:alkanesulfonate monooxygenase SsuD/methylene tetrahydromethanopterin reductase-like flavin-dependent oxidoreductase (luciferase family)